MVRRNRLILWGSLLNAAFRGTFAFAEPVPASRPAISPSAIVLSDDFEASASSAWSVHRLATTPADRRRFLGEFSSSMDPLRLRLEQLPPHVFVRIVFDLYLIHTWDGNIGPIFNTRIGPDVWQVAVVGGPVLIHSSFVLYTRYRGKQSFPDEYPGGEYERGTGAAALGTLGYTFQGRPMDAVYHFDLSIPHQADSLEFAFDMITVPQGLHDESWGLDNVRVEALPEPPGKDLDETWLRALSAALRDDDPLRAYEAVWMLISAGDRAVPYVRKGMRSDLDERAARRWIAQLDDPRVETRLRARQSLEAIGPACGWLLRESLSRPSLEVQLRLKELLADFDERPVDPADVLPYTRALRVLEVLNSPAAAEALAGLAAEAPAKALRDAAVKRYERVLKRCRIATQPR